MYKSREKLKRVQKECMMRSSLRIIMHSSSWWSDSFTQRAAWCKGKVGMFGHVKPF